MNSASAPSESAVPDSAAAAPARAWPRRHPWLTALALFALALAALIALWDWNWFKGPI